MVSSNPYGAHSYGQIDQRFERSRQADPAPYVHPSRMPAVDLSAPVIHFGTSREVAPRQSLKDQHFTRAQDEKGVAFLTAATKEQKVHTLFVGKISDEIDDFWMERLLKCIPKLRQWKRVLDGTSRNCSYGFAEYEDPESVDRAYQILKGIQIPVVTGTGVASHFLVTQDPMSKLYIEDSLALKENKTQDAKERNITSTALGQIDKVWRDFSNPKYKRPDEMEGKAGKPPKAIPDTTSESQAVTIMLSIEDELGDIPAEQRESIAKEITSFRDRSAKRDQERARQIADVEARRLETERLNRREAHKNPKYDSGEEIALIRRTKVAPQVYGEDGLTDEEIGKLRRDKHIRECETKYVDELRKWEAREASRITTFQRELATQQETAEKQEVERAYLAEKLAKFDDEKDSSRASVEYYRDRESWLRARASQKAREAEADRLNALEEDRELLSEAQAARRTERDQKAEVANGKLAPEAAPVRLQLAKKSDDTRTGLNNSEAILAEEEEDAVSKRVLVPLQYDDEPAGHVESGKTAQISLKEIIDQIPTSRNELFEHAVKWDRLSDVILTKVRAFVVKKIIEAIDMEEEDLTDLIIRCINNHGRPEEIENELNAAFGDAEESELTTTRIWRYLLILLETSEVFQQS